MADLTFRDDPGLLHPRTRAVLGGIAMLALLAMGGVLEYQETPVDQRLAHLGAAAGAFVLSWALTSRVAPWVNHFAPPLGYVGWAVVGAVGACLTPGIWPATGEDWFYVAMMAVAGSALALAAAAWHDLPARR